MIKLSVNHIVFKETLAVIMNYEQLRKPSNESWDFIYLYWQILNVLE
jgi:hypothetical protein